MSNVAQLNKTVHKWLSLFVGIQLIIWLATGLYFNLMDHDKATGNTQRERVEHTGDIQDFSLLSVDKLSQPDPQSMQFTWILGKPYYQLNYQVGPHSYQKKNRLVVNATNGEEFTVSAEIAKNIAQLSFKGQNQDKSTVELVTPPIDELPSEKNELWKVSMNDLAATHVYIDTQTGKVIAHINDDRRLRDFMFMLHFMDYGNNGGFNHWLIILFAIATLMLSSTGILWLIELIKNKQLSFNLKHKSKVIALSYRDYDGVSDITLDQNKSVFEGLAKKSIHLASSCGGGGTCGKCKFVSNKPLSITDADNALLEKHELTSGYRLACQHKVSEVNDIGLEQSPNVDHYEFLVTQTQFITPFIKEVRFKVCSGDKLTYRAGAYMRFYIPAGKNSVIPSSIPKEYQQYWEEYSDVEYEHDGGIRHYSLANFDTETDELVFNIRWQTPTDDCNRSGVGSSYLGALKVGEKVNVTGPYSEFYAPLVSNKQRVFIGAGSGLAPLKSIIFEQIIKNKNTNHNVLIFGARTEDDLFYKEDFERLENTHTCFEYIPVLSRASELWQGQKGYVQGVLSGYLAKQTSLANTEFYMCGPPMMMTAVENMLLAHEVNSNQIFKDNFNR